MKKWAVIASGILVVYMSYLWGCKSSPAGPAQNRPPSIPTKPFPVDGEANAYRNTNLSWTGGDPDSNTPSYTVLVYLDNGLTNFFVGQSGLGTAAYSFNEVLPFNTTYYWYVVSTDGEDTVTGPVWHFTTVQQPNLRRYVAPDYESSSSYDQSTHVLTCNFYFINNSRSAMGFGFRVGLYLSLDTVITSDDFLVGYATFPSLNPGQGGVVQGQLDLTGIPLSAGTYYVGIFVDYQNAVTEYDESDNTFVFPDAIILPVSSPKTNTIFPVEFSHSMSIENIRVDPALK